MPKPRLIGLRLLLSACLLGAAGLAGAQEGLRVMTFNIGLGASRSFMPQLISAAEAATPIARYIAAASGTGPAVVCLQEVDENRSRSGRVSVDHLVAALNAAGEPGWQGHYYPLVERQGDGSTGIAVLSRLPGAASPDHWQIFEGEEDRGALALQLEMGGRPLWVVNTHLGFRDQAGQLKKLMAGVDQRTRGASAVLCGDMNVADPAVGANPALQPAYDLTFASLLAGGFSSATTAPNATFPAWNPAGMKLDYLFLRPSAGLSARQSPLPAPIHQGRWLSDHRPLAIDLQYSAPIIIATE